MRVLMTGLFILLLITTLTFNSDAQNFIGMDKNQIMQIMKEKQHNYKLNTTTVNTHYNYLKYEDQIAEITILFFLSGGNRCTLVRKICDYSNINNIITELNAAYRPAGKNTWKYKDEGKTYYIILSEEEWFFTITTRLKE